MVAVWTICRDCDSDRKLEVIACSGEALCGGKLVSETESVGDPERKKENHDKIDDQRRSDADNGDDLVDDLVALRCEQHENSVK